ncbi:Uncharacterised protein [Yersinia thracica]|uniref:Uncharacterized protein n=1 Tax=Yersinia thracica TaxID=2890319 RepID=A0A0T9ND65_9GAMM|nr:Uncharacterised protein [Yersinia thracica]
MRQQVERVKGLALFLGEVRIGVSYPAIKPIWKTLCKRPVATWPDRLATLPMNEEHKIMLRAHWSQLHTDFRL